MGLKVQSITTIHLRALLCSSAAWVSVQKAYAGEFVIDNVTDFNAINIEDQLSVYPQFYEGFNAIAQPLNFDDGLALRGFGPARTLVLVDGKRLGWFGSRLRRFNGGLGDEGIFDADALPASFIDHVIVDTGGGSADHGSGAVAGAVNLVLKRNLQGVEISASNEFEIPGNHNNLLNVYAGAGTNFLDDRANVTLLGNITNSEDDNFNRFSLAGFASYEFADQHRIFLDSQFSHRKTDFGAFLITNTNNYAISIGATGITEKNLRYVAHLGFSASKRDVESTSTVIAPGSTPFDPFNPTFEILSIKNKQSIETEHLQAKLRIDQDISVLKVPSTQSAPVISIGTELRDLNFEHSVTRTGFDISPFSPFTWTELRRTGQSQVFEIFSNLDYPVFESRGLIDQAVVHGGYRFSQYSEGVGGISSYRAGGSIKFAPGVTFDANYQHNHRAPSIAELFTTTNITGFPAAGDPCALGGYSSVSIVSTCQGAGIPQTPGQLQIFANSIPKRDAEKADTLTFGFELAPTLINGLWVRFEYYSTELNAIDSISIQTILNLCHVEGIQQACNYLSGNSGSAVGSLNLDGVPSYTHNKGVELQAAYDVKTTIGDFTVQYFGGRILKTKIEDSLFNETRDCFQLECGNLIPKYNHTMTARYQTGLFGANVRWRRIGGTDLQLDPPPGVIFFNYDLSSDSTNYLDASIHADITEELRVTIGGRNLFDKSPNVPVIGSTVSEQPSNPFAFENLGRRLFADVSLRF